MSKLIVQVVKVKKVIPHPNADRLSIIEMESNSWNCIYEKNFNKSISRSSNLQGEQSCWI